MSFFTAIGTKFKEQLKAFPGVPEKKGEITFSSNIGVGSKIVSGIKAAPAIAKGLQTIALTGAAAIVGYSAIKENPKIATQAPKAGFDVASDFGTLIGKASKSDASMSSVWADVKDFGKEHPIASGIAIAGGVVGAGYAGLTGARLYSDYLTRTQLENKAKGFSSYLDYIPTIPTITPPPVSNGKGKDDTSIPTNDGAPLTSSGTPPNSGQGYIVTPDSPSRKVSTRRKKPKQLNKSSVSIRNYNIMAVKNGKSDKYHRSYRRSWS